MADVNSKVEKNVPGKFYVDTSCIMCGICEGIAPDNFILDSEIGYARVQKQPEDDAELAACQEAMSQCPMNAIGDDGE